MTVPILLPTGRDAELVGRVIAEERIDICICASMHELLGHIGSECGPFIVGDEAFSSGDCHGLIEALDGQADWSELPGLVLIGGRSGKRYPARLAARREIILIQRPIKKAFFTNIFRTAVEARRRQYQVRDLLEALVRTNEELRSRSGLLQKYALALTNAENNERKRIAQILHDDLQQMLASARLYTDMLLGDLDGETAGRAKPIYDILSDAMAASRTLSHELNPVFAIGGDIEEALRKLGARMAKDYGFRIQTTIGLAGAQVDEDIGVVIYRSVQELLFNCAKHARASQVSIELTRQDKRLKITVADDGAGFDPDKLNILGGKEGGFGLFSVQERATALGGCLQVHSAPDKGSTFILEIPMPADIDAETQHPEHSPRDNATGSHALSVMIADDHAVMRQGLAALLRSQPGIEVVAEASDGEQAVSLALQLQPDVILMDYSMPLMSGAEATRMIKAQAPHILVIGLSMYDGQNERKQMQDAGARTYLKKDVQAAELIAAIKQCT